MQANARPERGTARAVFARMSSQTPSPDTTRIIPPPRRGPKSVDLVLAAVAGSLLTLLLVGFLFLGNQQARALQASDTPSPSASASTSMTPAATVRVTTAPTSAPPSDTPAATTAATTAPTTTPVLTPVPTRTPAPTTVPTTAPTKTP